MTRASEPGRQGVHILVGAFALLLRVLSWWQAAGLAAAAVVFNLFVLPRVGRRLFRPGDLDAPLRSGIAIYPFAVLGLVLCFPRRLDIVATAWAILAAGDGFATLVGAHVRSTPLSWNRAKSVAGLAAFIGFGAPAAVGMMAWTTMDAGAPEWWVFFAPAVAAVVAGLVETAPIRLNDNISVPAAAALTLWTLSFVDVATLQASWPAAVGRLGPAILANLVVAAAGWRAGAVSIAGAVVGAIIGIATFVGAGWAGWTLLLAAFLAATVATRLGFRRKALLGIAEASGGRRGPGNAVANTGLAAWLAALSLGAVRPELALVGMVAALATSASDTVASEIGKAWGQTPWLVTEFRRVSPGTSGAVSAEGTAAGLVAAAGLAGLAVLLGLVPARAVAPIVAGATIAAFAESALGAWLEGPGILDNDALNFVNAAVGAGLAVLLTLGLLPPTG